MNGTPPDLRGDSVGIAGGMSSSLAIEDARDPRAVIWRTAFWVIPLFWLIQFSALTTLRNLIEAEPLYAMVPRLLVTLAGVATSFVVCWVQLLLRYRPFVLRIGFTLLAGLCGCAIHAFVNLKTFRLLMPTPDQLPLSLDSYGVAVLQWLWVYLALSSILLSLSYSVELRERERRFAKLQSIAHASQLRALRYQINPHFLFNTLNSIASLISQRQNVIAETMVENLSDFLRAGLAINPEDDITLAREIELQSLYLDVEAQRFPERLQVEINIPDRLRMARVPSLITQPLVENAIKYGVSKSTSRVQLRIEACEREGRLMVAVHNSAGDTPQPVQSGTSVGLANIKARLEARFEDEFEFAAAPDANGGFTATFSIPLTFEAIER